ncbi:DgyrCDS4506 [Dimorphilus gyrociliatus]|uniref:DgyrCDS4506 n=1 Tax=Dimorphilus gyrociliatus TaxID=2664684 RepID=A0A7I8VJU9_9ANNE|nr:DgyrCDS4506 [Dimorphilus gyrociliatus]
MELRRIVAKKQLPVVCKISTIYDRSLGEGEQEFIEEGSLFVLHCLKRERRAKVLGDFNEQFYISFNCSEEVELLPSDARLDDVEFNNVAEIMVNEPMPKLIRCIQPHIGKTVDTSVYVGEVLEISRIELNNEEQILVCLNTNAQTIRLNENDCLAKFSAMPSERLLQISELLEDENFPKRVRHFDEEKSDWKNLIIDCIIENDYVIATMVNNPYCLSIPVEEVHHRFEIINPTDELTLMLLSSLKPLYSNINTSFKVKEIGKNVPPVKWRNLAQPINGVLEEWKHSYDCKKFTVNYTKCGNLSELTYNSTLNSEFGRVCEIFDKDEKVEAISEWTNETVLNVLRELNLQKYVNKFHEENIDGSLLMHLTEEMLLNEPFCMTKYHALKLLNKLMV